MAESTPKPAEERKPVPAQDEDLEALTKAFEKIDADKKAKEVGVDEALKGLARSLDQVIEKQKLDSEFDAAFENIQDKPAIEAERDVDEIFGKIQLPESQEAPKAEGPKKKEYAGFVGDAPYRKAMQEFLQSRKIDVVLEHYKPDFAQAELFDKPFDAVLAELKIPITDDLDVMAREMNRSTNPEYEKLPPERQAAMDEMIKPMLGATIGLRRKWRDEVLRAVERKRDMLQDNLEQLTGTIKSLKGEELKKHEESIKKSRDMIENASALISGFSEVE